MIKNFTLATVLLVALPMFGQSMGVGISSGDQPMMAPPPVGVGGESMAFAPEMERSNYLRGGLSVQALYNDNLFSSAPAQSDVSYTILPNIAFDITRSRLRWDLSYSPGFTVYQKFTGGNQVDHVFSTSLQYAVSPHVTLALNDSLAKTPSFSGLLQPGTNVGGTNVGQISTVVVVPPLIDTLSNNDSGQLTYQFRPNSMIGFGGNSSETYFLSNQQLQGLSDSLSRGGEFFYSNRIGGKHYIGANYSFEDIVSHPTDLETQVHSTTVFYSFYPTHTISFSVFGGAQHADTEGPGFPQLVSWSPTEGGGFNWQGQHNSLALNFSRSINTGGGLEGAVHSYGANAAFRHQFTEHLTATLQTTYSKNEVLQAAGLPDESGNTLLFGASLQRALGQHLSAELGYNRINQNYSDIAAVASNPSVDRGWITITYQFDRPIGR